MALELNGTTGVSLVQNGVITDANLPAGSVLQVVSTKYSTEVSTALSDTMVDTGLSASITPSSASSKILVVVTQHILVGRSGDQQLVGVRLLRDATEVFTGDAGSNVHRSAGGTYVGASSFNTGSIVAINLLDSPSTTSSVTYKTQMASQYASATCVAQSSGVDSTITLMEIAG